MELSEEMLKQRSF